MELKERSQQVLKAVVFSYIKIGYPIGSLTITENYRFGLSPATIRNIMAELEEMGYLSQPHTSSGRIPTEKGYRFYVDYVAAMGRPQGQEFGFLEESRLAPKREDLKELLQETSQLLSFLSHYTGIVMAPNLSNTLFKRLEFITLRRDHLLVILVTQDGFIQNRIIEVTEDLEQADLDRIASYLNEQFSGLDLQEVRRRLLHQMGEEKELYDRILSKAIELGQKALSAQPESELYLGGTANILNLPEFADLEKMKALFRAFEEKAVIVKLLNKCLDAEGVQVFIGSENENEGMEHCSLVVTNYKRGSRTLGTLGVIGPTRMEYERVIPLVDHTAKLLTRLLEQD
ncbi:MAG TPA: heat-inducible transcriptional repressor HrcA [Nitrospiria bacterium]|nr:heat-inducible transcriptional repressor HrcA [Nitrospiria bacterium]